MSLDTIDLDTTTQEILLAASNHDLEALKPFLRVPGAASVQDQESGTTPLHAAIAACGPARRSREEINGVTKGHLEEVNRGDKVESEREDKEEMETENTEGKDGEEDDIDIEKAKATIRELFLSGAIWNDLDANDETPGCLAWRLGWKELYEMVVEAGVRAELLLNLMGGYERLEDEDDEEDEEEGAAEVTEELDAKAQEQSKEQSKPTTADLQNQQDEPPDQPPSPQKDVNSADYLSSSLSFTPSKLLDSSLNGVMMSWETPIMSLTASLLCPLPALRILNIGFGMGIIDRLFATTNPSIHHIIEAHPDVLAKLGRFPDGMPLDPSALQTPTDTTPLPDDDSERDNFHFFNPTWQLTAPPGSHAIYAGKWQSIVPSLLAAGHVYDAIYFDTFAEDYSQLKLFFSEYLIGLLSENGRFSFFNGLGADRRVCYDVYCRVVEAEMWDAGVGVEWREVPVEMEDGDAGREWERGLGIEGDGEWKGVRRRYWTLERYRLPICTFVG